MRNLFFMFLTFISLPAAAQHLTGAISDEQQGPLAGASVSIRRPADSAVIKFALTNTKGQYSFDGLMPGAYYLQASHIGYADRRSPVFIIKEDSHDLPSLQLVKVAGSLASVTVTGRKPLIEVTPDRTILNVEGSVNSVGQNALDLLSKSPGVTVDKDNNITLSGKNGIKVYIDGRKIALNGTDLADYLQTLQSSEIEAIEIISNPSAKYDAEGNAGIINIRLKKNRSFGNNGSVTGGYYLGTHSNYNAGLSLNHRDSHLNWFGSYDYNNTTNTAHRELYRVQLDSLFDQHSWITTNIQSHSFKTGLDYSPDKHNTIGIMMDGSLANFNTPTNSYTDISYGGVADRILEANNSTSGHRNNGNLNLNYRHTDSLGHELSVDGNYGIFRIRRDQYQPNLYFDPTGSTLLYSDVYDMLSPTNIDIYNLKADYERNVKKGRLSLGIKTSYVTSGNDFQQYDVVSRIKLPDTLNSSGFNYKENVNAAYANYSRPFSGWSLQAGLRIENTNARGISNGYRQGNDGYLVNDSVFNLHYTDFFPSGAITYNKDRMRQWTLSYSRRIDRPAYQDLNPFQLKVDEYTYQQGNPDLQPQYTNSVGLSYVYKIKLVTTLNYSHVKDVIAQLVDTIDRSKAFLTRKNLATQDITSLNISYPLQLGWYSLFTNVNSYYTLYQAYFGPGRTVNLHAFAVKAFGQQSMRLGKGWTAEMSGFYTTPTIWQGTFKVHAIGSLDAGIQKSVLQKKGTIKVSVSDVFHTFQYNAVSDFAGQYLRATGGSETRQLKVYFTYKFGNAQVKAAKAHKTGSEEEGKRSNSQGGGLAN